MPKSPLALLLLVAACSSASPGPDAAEECYAVGTTWCERNTTCARQAGATDPNLYADCQSGFLGAVDCSRMTHVTGHPDVCRADIGKIACDTFGPNGLIFPASCKNVVAN